MGKMPKSPLYKKLTSHVMTVSLVMLALQSSACRADDRSRESAIPEKLQGQWQVAELFSEENEHYFAADQRLIGRIFDIGARQLTTNAPEKQDCRNPTASQRSTTLAAAISDSMKWSASNGKPPVALTFLADPTESGVSKDEAIDVFQIRCDGGALFGRMLGKAAGIQGAWMTLGRSDKLVIRWYDETVLLLKRLPRNAVPKPSFNCAKASLPAEKAICTSVALASFDASVAEAYQQLKTGDYDADAPNAVDPHPEITRALQLSQRQWLKSRNECAADTACLQTSMELRLRELYSAEPCWSTLSCEQR